MFVRHVMIPLDHVIAVRPDTEASAAYQTARTHGLHALPVIEQGKLLGAVQTVTLLEALDHGRNQLPVRELLTPTGKAVLPGDVIEVAAQNLLGQAVNFLPVEEADGGLAGIVTRDGLFREMCRLFGGDANNVRFTLLVREQSGQLERLAHAIASLGGNISHIATRQSDTRDHQLLVVRVEAADPHALIRSFEQLGFHVLEVFDERTA